MSSIALTNNDGSPALKRAVEVISNNSFKPGWNFDEVLATDHKFNNSEPTVIVTVSTPFGAEKWGRAFLISKALLEDDTFDLVKFLNEGIENLAVQFDKFKGENNNA